MYQSDTYLDTRNLREGENERELITNTKMEGGAYPWRRQKLNIAPAVSYKNLNKPLLAPKNQQWYHDSQKNEWSLVAASSSSYSRAAASRNVVVSVARKVTTNELASTTTTADIVVADAVTIQEDGDDLLVEEAQTTTIEKEEEEIEDDITGNSPYLNHYIKPTDTFQGICIKYKVKALELRRANGGLLTGLNIYLVPTYPVLRIPKNEYNSMMIMKKKQTNNSIKKTTATPPIDVTTITTVEAVVIGNDNDYDAITSEKEEVIVDAGTATTTSTTCDEEEEHYPNQYQELTQNDVINILIEECAPMYVSHDEAYSSLNRTEWNFVTALEAIKIKCIRKRCPGLFPTEAKAYLMLNGWNLHAALRDAQNAATTDECDDAQYVFE